LYVKNNIPFRNFKNESGKEAIWQIVLPKALRKFVLKQVHDSVTGGHLGITKTPNCLFSLYILKISKRYVIFDIQGILMIPVIFNFWTILGNI
jgi:hypothetical protein